MASTILETASEVLYERFKKAKAIDAPISWGPVVGDNRPDQFVAVGFGPQGESGASTREWGPIATKKLNETFELPLMVEVLQTGTDLQPSYKRSTELAKAVEDSIREDTTLGGIVLLSVKLSKWAGHYFKSDKGQWGHRQLLTISGTARI